MSIRIKFAETPREIDDVHRLRHRVLVDEEGYFAPRPDGRIVDGCDAAPGTRCVVAYDGDDAVGTVRITLPSADGTLPIQRWWDFSPFLRPEDRAAEGSMLCVARSHREDARVFLSLVGIPHHYLVAHGYSHVVVLANPDVEHLFMWAGGTRVGERFHLADLDLPAVPITLELGALDERILAFTGRQSGPYVLSSFEREYAAAGETIVTCGEASDRTYVIISGRVAVTCPSGGADGAPPPVLAEFGPGDFFGELAAVTGRPRTADVTALTDVELMTIEADSLISHLGDLATLRSLFEAVAERMSTQGTVLMSVFARARAARASAAIDPLAALESEVPPVDDLPDGLHRSPSTRRFDREEVATTT